MDAFSNWYSKPAFVDIDGDGDMDVFLGTYYNNIRYYQNTGTASAPVYTEQTGASNPLDGSGFYAAAPVFVDIDGDGDKDVFIVTQYTGVRYLKNTGTATVPVFTEQTGVSNPFGAINVYNYCTLSFVDIDGDGDLDAFAGNWDGTILYYKNTGTATAPVFTQQTGAANPMDGIICILLFCTSFWRY